ncbi:hypothetical protein BDV95DRAFT_532960 [Massariosphaeria phaeospora]|uniref:Heterokaryon incompatibility domain-containing protein n=1 Tax=Massariosphaeria phaeospora TaxID=100035 RepID=A0A7C8MYA6_9PLEO|nr:hypothetical protein BDV95DRAFT_532960 [Massariosphaeria phaeospora]
MRAIYSNAFCNFGAIAAAETHAGLFVDSDPCLISAFPFTFKRQHRDMDCYGSSAKGSTVIDRSNLMKRGWVLQERMLSPRSVFFDEQLRWECSEMVACETLPKGQLSRENLMSYHPPLRVHSLHPGGNSSLSEERIKDVHNRWLELVETYTRCDLTFEKDKLPAISDDIGISEIAGARIRISSCLRQSQRGVIDPSILLLSRHEWYDDPHGREGQSPSEGSFLLLLIYGEPYTRHVAALFGDFCEELMPAQVRGLILEPVQTEPEQLERYPEFQNFDPEDFETSTLTLI